MRPLLTSLPAAVRVVAVVGAAAALGVAAATLLSGGGGDGAPTPPSATAAASTASPPPRTATTTAAPASRPPPPAAPQSVAPREGAATPRVEVLSAVLYPAVTARGRARRRARVTVRVRVTNRDTATLTPPNPLLLTSADRIGTDPRADDRAGALLKPIAPAASATGELRYEIAGAVTERLTAKPRARLAIVNRIVGLKIAISPAPAPPR